MTKPVVIIQIFICTLCNIYSQPYKAVYSQRTVFYEEDYLKAIRALRIDSVSFERDSVFYPFHNIRKKTEYCYTPEGASWIGEKIIVKDDGHTLFFSLNNDTIDLSTLAGLNNSWTMCRIDPVIFRATVTKLDTLSFLGFTDSVKTISIQAFDLDLNPVEHSINNQYLLLSKHYGLICTMNFYYFPDLQSEYPEYETLVTLSMVGITNPNSGVQNIKWLDVFNFQPGDELHIVDTSFSDDFQNNSWMRYEKLIKKYLSRQDFIDSVVYEAEITQSVEEILGQEYSSEYNHEIKFETYKPDSVFDLLPGVAVPARGNAYQMVRSAKIEPSVHQSFSTGDVCWIPTVADGCFPSYNYYIGLGGPYTYCTNAFSFGKTERKLVYYKKGEITSGQPLVITSAGKIPEENILLIYPNPSKGTFLIRLNDQNIKHYYISVINMQGQVLIEDKNYMDNTPVDLRGHSGTLLVKVITPDRTFYRKLVMR